jgi:antitoxin MazE
MKVAFLKWGNSLALRVPKAFAQEIGAVVGKAANMEVRDGKLVVEIVKPNRRRRRYTLEQLVAGISPENRHRSAAAKAAANSIRDVALDPGRARR